MLRGPRRACKSTEIKHAIADLLNSDVTPRRIIHAAVDGWIDRDLRTLVTSAAQTFLAGVDQPRFWFIDEITSINGDWPSTVKNLRDTDRRFHDDTVVLTGSSATRLEDARKALAGRRGPISDSDRMLLPMRFTDFARAAGAVCLESLVTDVGASLLSLTLESRAELDHYDLSTLHGAVQRNGVQFTYEHVDPHKEPILWAADAVVWAAGGSRDWRRRIESIAVVDRSI